MRFFNKRIIALVVVLAVAFSTISFGTFSTPAKSLCENGHRQLTSVAHRGYSAGAPENTLPAFRMAKEKGFTYVECDVAFTSDGVPVLLHLDNIESTSNGSGNVYDLTYQQLLQYDFGSWKGSQFTGTKIPTFEEFVALCAELGLHPYIELKESGRFTQDKIGQLVSILEKYDMLNNCTWITFIHDYLFYVRNLDSDARMGLLWPNDINQSLITKAQSIKTDSNEVFLDVKYESLTTSGINRAASNGFALEVYTINSEQTMANLPDYISGFTSDFLLAPSVTDKMVSVVTEPTCTDKGYTTYTCNDCGYSVKENYVSNLGHNFNSNGECTRCNFKVEEFVFYVYAANQGGADSNDGLSTITPVATFDKAINVAKSYGAKKGDTVKFYIKGNVNWGGNINDNGISTNWEVLTQHDFKVIVTAADNSTVLGNGEKNVILGGEIQFEAIKINSGSSWKSLCFNGYSAVINNTAFTDDSFDFILGTRSSRTVDVATNVTINTYRPKIFLGNSYQTLTYNQKFTFNLQGNANINTSSIILVMGPNDSAKTVYNAGADMIINIPNVLTFQNADKVEIGTKGYLNIINNVTNKAINLSDISFSSATKTKVWVLNHKSNVTISSTNKAGEFAVPQGYTATATPISGNAIKSVEGKLTLSAGQYDINVQPVCQHQYTNDCDTSCNLCGEERTVIHNYKNIKYDAEKHWNECDCGVIDDENCYGHGYSRYIDEEMHWLECYCGHKTDVEPHEYKWIVDTEPNCFENGSKHQECVGCADIKSENTTINPTGTHTYDNACDSVCNINGCGFTRVTEHVFDHACDTECNTVGCGFTRDTEHVYDHACDTDCNTEGCGFTRITEHVYDHACDTECNTAGCGFTRDTEHVYDNDSDKDCNVEGCDFVRAIGAELREENGVIYYYENGVKSTDTGIVDYEGKKMYINKGRFLGATGLVTLNGKKMYINKGYFLGASGLVTINGKKTYINKGYFTGASGLVTISGKKVYINKGYFTGASGLVTISGKKMYINKGYFTGASGLVTISGKKMYINKGYFTGATGIVTIGGKKHYINKGYFTGASGKVNVGGKTYTVVKGIVKF